MNLAPFEREQLIWHGLVERGVYFDKDDEFTYLKYTIPFTEWQDRIATDTLFFWINRRSFIPEGVSATRDSSSSLTVNERYRQVKKTYSKIDAAYFGYPDFTHIFSPLGQLTGIFLMSEIPHVWRVIQHVSLGPDTRVVDLGSGLGNVVALFAVHNILSVTGWEMDYKLYWSSRQIVSERLAAVLRAQSVGFKNTNIFEEDWSSYDVLFYYWNSIFADLKPLFFEKLKEVKPGAQLIVFDPMPQVQEEFTEYAPSFELQQIVRERFWRTEHANIYRR